MIGKAIYLKDGHPICSTVIDNKDELHMEINAGFKIMCLLPNIEFDEIKICEVYAND